MTTKGGMSYMGMGVLQPGLSILCDTLLSVTLVTDKAILQGVCFLHAKRQVTP